MNAAMSENSMSMVAAYCRLQICYTNHSCTLVELPVQWTQQSGCKLQVANAQKGGASVALIYNNEEDGFVKMTADSSWTGVTITMPSAFIPASTARPLLQDILAGANLTVTFSGLTLPTNRWESLAYFSSVGPTLDGRYKPDLIAPGTTISPYSDE